MLRHYPIRQSIYLCLLVILMTGCTQAPSSIGTPTNNARMLVKGKREHMKDRLTMEDFRALAAAVTEKMLASRVVRIWQKKNWRPLLVVAMPENTTHDADILTKDLQKKIINRILASDVAGVIEESSLTSRYDYIIRTTITDTVQLGRNGSRLIYYTCKLQLFSMRGERLGQWHSMIGLAKAPRPLW